MAKGQYYFARVLSSETTFNGSHLRVDDNVFSYEVSQQEGEFAMLRIVIKNPRVPPLKLGEKVHCWFAVDCGSGELFKFFGRLVALPNNLIGSMIEYEYVARPPDYDSQKEALAESLKDLPFYDRIFIDPQAEEDPDSILEGYGARFHTPRDSLTVTVSDELSGEDGVLDFGPEDTIFDGLDIRIEGVQKTKALVNAELPWTQLADGGVDLTEWVTENWVNDYIDVPPGLVTSFTLTAQGWPANGASMGNGWTVVSGGAQNLFSVDVNNFSETRRTIHEWASGSTTQLENSVNTSYIGTLPVFNSAGSPPPGSLVFPAIVTEDTANVEYADDGFGGQEETSFNRSYAHTITVVPMHIIRPTLVVAYKANRPFTERWRFALTADVQPVMSVEDDAGIIRLNDLRARNLSEPIEDSSDGEIPIGDPKRRSYINSARGQQSLRHVICVARAALRRAARICNVTVVPLLHHMPAVTLRKSALITDGAADRIPGGSALGKIIAYSLSGSGETGAIECSVKAGCAVGRGGTVEAVEGEGLYVDKGALGPDIQEFTGRILTLDDDDVGFSIPNFAPDDDGLGFESTLTIDDILESGPIFNNPPAIQAAALLGAPLSGDKGQTAVEERSTILNTILRILPTAFIFKLRALDGAFEPAYEIDLTNLKIPQGINLES